MGKDNEDGIAGTNQADIREYAMKLQNELHDALDENETLSKELSNYVRMLEQALDNLAGGVGIFEIHGKKPVMKYMSKSFYNMFHVTEEQMKKYNENYVMLAIPEDRDVLSKQILETITSNRTTVREVRFTDVNTGGYFWIQICLSVMSIQKGMFVLCAVFMDVTGRMETELESRAQAEMLRLILQGSGDSVIEYDVKNDCMISRRVVDGVLTVAEQMEHFFRDIMSNPVIYGEDRVKVSDMYSQLTDKTGGDDKISGDIRLDLTRSGRWEWYRTLFVKLVDKKGSVCRIFGKCFSIDEEVNKSRELQLRAERDSLTGLYNRLTFQNKSTAMLAEFPGELCAFFIMDVDNFKHINDAFGHSAGDDLLCDIAVILRKTAVSMGGFAGRMGGDEFALFMPVMDSREAVNSLAADIMAELPSIKCGLSHTVSIGISIHSIDESVTFDRLYSESDQALYAAKRSGKNRYCEFSENMTVEEKNGVYLDYKYSDDDGLMLDEISDAAYVADMGTHELYFLNRAAKRYLGIAENDESYKGRKCYEVLQNLKSKCGFCANDMLASDRSYVWYHYNDKIDAAFVVKDKIVYWHDKKCVLEIAVDVSDMGKVTGAISDNYDIEDAMSGSLACIASQDSQEEKFRNLLELMGAFYDSKNACIVEYGREDGSGLYYWKSSDAESIGDALTALTKPSVRDVLSHEVADGDTLVVNRSRPLTDSNTEFARLLTDNRIWSLYAVPVMVDSELVGRVFVFNPERHNGNVRLMKNCAMFIGSEISRRRVKELQKFEFTHDRQTKCYNRNSYIDYLRNRKRCSSMGFMSVDANETRGIADMFGSDYADNVILSMADKIKKAFPDQMIFRMGYDNFIIICENMDKQKFSMYASRLKERLSYGDFTACCGYVWDDYDIDVRRMEEHAANILYSEKQKWYDDQQFHSAKWNTMKKEIVKKEIAEGLYSVVYQPKVKYPDGTVCGAEALVRYSGEGNLEDVIGRLEKSRTVKYVDFYVLDTVCYDMARWLQDGVKVAPVSCNFSRVSLLETDIAGSIAAVVDKYKLPHDLIEIEITETVSEEERDTLLSISGQIHDRGFRIAMDDFGTKYSNVSLLAAMGFDIIKFDKTMVRGVDTNRVTHAMIKHLINMCRELGMRCIAEGVETDSEARVLKDMGLDCIQGFLYSKPLAADEYIEFCSSRGSCSCS